MTQPCLSRFRHIDSEYTKCNDFVTIPELTANHEAFRVSEVSVWNGGGASSPFLTKERREHTVLHDRGVLASFTVNVKK